MPRKTRKMRGGCDCAMKGGSAGQGQLLPDLSIRHYYPLNQYDHDPSRTIASDRLTPIKVGGSRRRRRNKRKTEKRSKKTRGRRVRGGNYLSIVSPGLGAGAVKTITSIATPAMI